jgi:hypothetical protein
VLELADRAVSINNQKLLISEGETGRAKLFAKQKQAGMAELAEAWVSIDS